MKDLLSQLFGLSLTESVSVERRKSIDKINKKIKPITTIEISPLGIKEKISGYEHRQDNIDFILNEYRKSDKN